MENIELAVKALLNIDDGHGFDHIERVRSLAVKFAHQEHANVEIVELAALLHDVDDYKLFGAENAKSLLNARRILQSNEISESTQARVLDVIATMGYSKYLDGVRPTTLEGMVVSDADMCDAIGAQGILRTYAYNLSKGSPFFDKNTLPAEKKKTAEQYKAIKTEHATQHFFDKLLIINEVLMTQAGQREGAKRQKIMVDFLAELFREEESQLWQDYLRHFLDTE